MRTRPNLADLGGSPADLGNPANPANLANPAMATPDGFSPVAPLIDPESGDRMVSVSERQAPPDYTFIPADVCDYFSARGLKASLASGFAQSVQQLALRARFPVLLEDIDEARRDDLKRSLRMYGFTFKDGYVWKGDAIVFVQSFEARQEQIREGMDLWFRTEHGTEARVADELNDELRRNDVTHDKAHVRIQHSRPGR